MSEPLRVLHADETLVAVDKPAGLLSVPGRGPDKADCAWARVRERFADALVVHRLDMATSGVLLFARGPAAQRALSRCFELQRTDKGYTAVATGLLAQDSGQIDLPLACDWPHRPRQQVDLAHGRPSLTRWQVLARDPTAGTTRLALTPLSGRTHQLRVHLQAIGHPLLGDALYAPADVQAAAPRLLLHAHRLAVPHPASGLPIVIESPPPF